MSEQPEAPSSRPELRPDSRSSGESRRGDANRQEGPRREAERSDGQRSEAPRGDRPQGAERDRRPRSGRGGRDRDDNRRGTERAERGERGPDSRPPRSDQGRSDSQKGDRRTPEQRPPRPARNEGQPSPSNPGENRPGNKPARSGRPDRRSEQREPRSEQREPRNEQREPRNEQREQRNEQRERRNEPRREQQSADPAAPTARQESMRSGGTPSSPPGSPSEPGERRRRRRRGRGGRGSERSQSGDDSRSSIPQAVESIDSQRRASGAVSGEHSRRSASSGAVSANSSRRSANSGPVPVAVAPSHSRPNSGRRQESIADPASTARARDPDQEPDSDEDDVGSDVKRLRPVSALELPPDVPVRMANLCAVRFRPSGMIYELDCGSQTYSVGDLVLCESDRGQRIGRIEAAARPRPAMSQRRKVLRKARPDESGSFGDSQQSEVEAYRFCKARLRELSLPMKLLSVEIQSGQRATFFFASEDRVDFRDLVRDLSQRLRLRVEMRQVGARDGAKAVGGIGSCGRELCCSTFLPAFQPISIRMAKDQGMVLNPSKLAGQCGRLKCCLIYEHSTYKELGKTLPKVGKKVLTPEGMGRVLDLDILKQRVRVYLEEGGAKSFAAAEVRSANAPHSAQTPEPHGPDDLEN